MLSKSMTATESNSLQSINISKLPQGSYFLKVASVNGDKEEQVIRFEKL